MQNNQSRHNYIQRQLSGNKRARDWVTTLQHRQNPNNPDAPFCWPSTQGTLTGTAMIISINQTTAADNANFSFIVTLNQITTIVEAYIESVISGIKHTIYHNFPMTSVEFQFVNVNFPAGEYNLFLIDNSYNQIKSPITLKIAQINIISVTPEKETVGNPVTIEVDLTKTSFDSAFLSCLDDPDYALPLLIDSIHGMHVTFEPTTLDYGNYLFNIIDNRGVTITSETEINISKYTINSLTPHGNQLSPITPSFTLTEQAPILSAYFQSTSNPNIHIPIQDSFPLNTMSHTFQIMPLPSDTYKLVILDAFNNLITSNSTVTITGISSTSIVSVTPNKIINTTPVSITALLTRSLEITGAKLKLYNTQNVAYYLTTNSIEPTDTFKFEPLTLSPNTYILSIDTLLYGEITFILPEVIDFKISTISQTIWEIGQLLDLTIALLNPHSTVTSINITSITSTLTNVPFTQNNSTIQIPDINFITPDNYTVNLTNDRNETISSSVIIVNQSPNIASFLPLTIDPDIQFTPSITLNRSTNVTYARIVNSDNNNLFYPLTVPNLYPINSNNITFDPITIQRGEYFIELTNSFGNKITEPIPPVIWAVTNVSPTSWEINSTTPTFTITLSSAIKPITNVKISTVNASYTTNYTRIGNTVTFSPNVNINTQGSYYIEVYDTVYSQPIRSDAIELNTIPTVTNFSPMTIVKTNQFSPIITLSKPYIITSFSLLNVTTSDSQSLTLSNNSSNIIYSLNPTTINNTNPHKLLMTTVSNNIISYTLPQILSIPVISSISPTVIVKNYPFTPIITLDQTYNIVSFTLTNNSTHIGQTLTITNNSNPIYTLSQITITDSTSYTLSALTQYNNTLTFNLPTALPEPTITSTTPSQIVQTLPFSPIITLSQSTIINSFALKNLTDVTVTPLTVSNNSNNTTYTLSPITISDTKSYSITLTTSNNSILNTSLSQALPLPSITSVTPTTIYANTTFTPSVTLSISNNIVSFALLNNTSNTSTPLTLNTIDHSHFTLSQITITDSNSYSITALTSYNTTISYPIPSTIPVPTISSVLPSTLTQTIAFNPVVTLSSSAPVNTFVLHNSDTNSDITLTPTTTDNITYTLSTCTINNASTYMIKVNLLSGPTLSYTLPTAIQAFVPQTFGFEHNTTSKSITFPPFYKMINSYDRKIIYDIIAPFNITLKTEFVTDYTYFNYIVLTDSLSGIGSFDITTTIPKLGLSNQVGLVQTLNDNTQIFTGDYYQNGNATYATNPFTADTTSNHTFYINIQETLGICTLTVRTTQTSNPIYTYSHSTSHLPTSDRNLSIVQICKSNYYTYSNPNYSIVN